MAYRDYRVEVFIPAGRQRQMSVLLDNLARFEKIIDRVQVWYNVDDDQIEDGKWLKSLPDIYNDWVDLKFLTSEQYKIKPKQLRTALFYKGNTIKKDTIYIRADDDICYLDDNWLTNLLDFRIDHPDYFLVMANIVNNSLTSYIYQEVLKVITNTYGELTAYCMDPISWGSGAFAVSLHQKLIDHITDNTVEDFFFDHADLTDATRFSISCFCFFGKDFAEFNGVIGQRRPGVLRYDEEIWLCEIYPVLHNKLSTICGTALVAHYSFLRQRAHLDKTDILETYRAIGKGKLSDSYYDLLEADHNQKETKNASYKIVKLPKVEQISTHGSALTAEKTGFKAVQESDRVNIVFEDKIVKTLLGRNLSDADIDRGLAAAYNNINH